VRGHDPERGRGGAPEFTAHLDWFVEHRPQFARHIDRRHLRAGTEGRLLAIVGPERLARILDRLLDEDELLSPHGIRSVSARHREEPFVLHLAGMAMSVDYAPAEGTTGLFGGNSNWRGPVWFPSTRSSSMPCGLRPLLRRRPSSWSTRPAPVCATP
jgi:hypothetical protein